MADFMRVFSELDRWGPGSEQDTLKALSTVPFEPQQILEIGCGKGVATTVLATHTSAHIVAVDNDEPALARLRERAREAGLSERIETACHSMQDLPFEEAIFDVIWSEGSAYIMGLANAFEAWRPLLKTGGVLVVSDLVWLTDSPSNDARAFWQEEYPDMSTVSDRVTQATAAGYTLIDTFELSEAAWSEYIGPLAKRAREVASELPDSAALQDLERELEIYRNHLGEFGYQMFVFRKD